MEVISFEKDLLVDIAGYGWAAMKEMERDRVFAAILGGPRDASTEIGVG